MNVLNGMLGDWRVDLAPIPYSRGLVLVNVEKTRRMPCECKQHSWSRQQMALDHVANAVQGHKSPDQIDFRKSAEKIDSPSRVIYPCLNIRNACCHGILILCNCH